MPELQVREPRDLISISGIHLYKVGDEVVASLEVDGCWYQIIAKTLRDGEGFSEIVEPNGIRQLIKEPPSACEHRSNEGDWGDPNCVLCGAEIR